jgi:hypothetical protein
VNRQHRCSPSDHRRIRFSAVQEATDAARSITDRDGQGAVAAHQRRHERMPCGTLLIVWLMGAEGHGVALQVVGYQFPDADDPAQRFSWHMLEGSATCVEGSWQFRYPALTCDESPRVGGWLRDVAAGCATSAAMSDVASSAELTFTEPNLSLVAVPSGPATAMLDIGLSLEFAPPWSCRHAAGAPYVIRCEMTREQLMQAAAEWEAEIAPYPER